MSSGCAAVGIGAVVVALSLCGCSSDASSPSSSSGSQPAHAPAPAQTPPPAQPPAAAPTSSAPEWDRPISLTDAELPPLPSTGFAPARPIEVVREVYAFAARHPEVLSHVPCFCGCESRGHKHNDDCFVTSRDAKGRPTAWEPHGVG